jgi:hypothetical protein
MKPPQSEYLRLRIYGPHDEMAVVFCLRRKMDDPSRNSA